MNTRLCFFIDGLNEYDGNQQEIIEMIKHFTISSDISVCFSSRPWNVFENAYGDSGVFKIQVQDLTQQDIVRFVSENLKQDHNFQQLKMSDPRYEDLVKKIANRVCGVFLWVFLVVREIWKGFTGSDMICELE